MAATKDSINDGENQGVETAHIRSRIDQTRAEMDQTMNQIGEQLSPKRVINEVIGIFQSGDEGAEARRAARKAGRRVKEAIKDHPLGSALIGAGVAYMLFFEDREDEFDSWNALKSMRPATNTSPVPSIDESGPSFIGEKLSSASNTIQDAASRAADSMKDTAESVKERVGDLADRAKEGFITAKDQTAQAVGSLAGTLSDKARHLGQSVKTGVSEASIAVKDRAAVVGQQIREGYTKGYEQACDMADENPLAVGAVVLGLGLLAGLLLPRTRKEDQFLGEKADEIKGCGKELLNRGLQVAEVATEEAVNEARRQGLTPGTLIDKAKRVVSETRNAAGESAEREEIDPATLGEKIKNVADRASDAAMSEIDQQMNRVEEPVS